jgi:hypothetical protein
MWKKLIFLFLVTGVLVILIGCGGGIPVLPPGDETTTDEEFNDIIDTGENAIDKFEEYCNSIGEEQAYQATVDFLEQQNGVKEAGIGEDGTTIWFEYENGYLVGIFSTEEDEKANEKGISLPFDQSKVMPSAEKALILNPGFHLYGTYKAQKIKGKLNSLYGNYDYESGLDVSIELMKELYKYSVVYIVTHGGFIKDYLCFALSVRATTDIKDQYDYYFTKPTNKYLTTAFIDGEPYIGITPSFIRECNSGTFPDSLICIDACYSLQNSTMAQAFLDKGAYAYCGYTTTMYFIDNTPVDFFENLISEEMSVEDAIDNLSNNNFTYYPENHGDLYLVEGGEDCFLGYWVNEDANTPSITKIDIQKNNNLLEIYMWGKCHPTDCDWAAMNNPGGPATTTVDDADDGVLNIVWYPDFAIETQEITYLGGDRLEVYTFTDFYPDDIYGREDYERYDYFIKSN